MNIKTQKLESTFNHILENHPQIKNTTSKERIKKLRKLKKNIFLYRNEIKRALFEDFKKSSSDVDLTEIFPVISEIKHNIKEWKHANMIYNLIHIDIIYYKLTNCCIFS